MKTLIIGANGMLGHELGEAFKDWEPVLWDIQDIDITNQAQVQEKISALSPELIINAAAYTNVDACEENEALAMKVNGDAVGYLANAAKQVNATLVHYSTDYVFNGDKGMPYVESDKPNPVSAYGRTKAAGERNLIASGLANYYILRITWLYGAHGKNFVNTMLELADKGQPIKVVDDQIGSPTYAGDVAQATRALVTEKRAPGIYHRPNNGQTSWYGFAKEIFAVFGRTVDLSPCTTAEFPRPAKRPAFSVLQSTKLPAMRPWQEALKVYQEEVVNTK